MTYQSAGGVFHCDECPDLIETSEPEFQAALEAAVAAGWRAFKGPDKQWAHACPACVAIYAASSPR